MKIKAIIQQFQKRFLTGDYMGDGEEMVSFLESVLLSLQAETEKETAEAIIKDIETQGTVFTRKIELEIRDWDKIKYKYIKEENES